MQVSIVVRSFNRLLALLELLPALLGQRHDSFEVVVVEQSTDADPDDTAALTRLEADPRLRVLRSPPLGGARARNVGVRAARGEIVVFVDDDDLPVGEDWIAGHVANYDDPDCLGVTGRHVYEGNDEATYSDAKGYRRCQAFSPLLRMPWAYVRQSRRKVPVDQVHGTNGSIRKSAFVRFGGWDEDTRIEDEASFAYRAERKMRDGEYFCFDPMPLVMRRMDVMGGLDKRFMTAGAFYRRLLLFVHRIIGRYHRVRVVLLYPLYLLTVYGWTVDWVFSDAKGYRSTASKLWATVALLPLVPVHAIRCALTPAPRIPTPTESGTDSRLS